EATGGTQIAPVPITLAATTVAQLEPTTSHMAMSDVEFATFCTGLFGPAQGHALSPVPAVCSPRPVTFEELAMSSRQASLGGGPSFPLGVQPMSVIGYQSTSSSGGASSEPLPRVTPSD